MREYPRESLNAFPEAEAASPIALTRDGVPSVDGVSSCSVIKYRYNGFHLLIHGSAVVVVIGTAPGRRRRLRFFKTLPGLAVVVADPNQELELESLALEEGYNQE